MILNFTTAEHTNLLDFLSNHQEYSEVPIRKMVGTFDLSQFVVRDMRNFSHFTEVVIDRTAFTDTDKEFVDAIEQFLTMYYARITVIDENITESDKLFKQLLDIGVGNIVTAFDIATIQAEILACISDNGLQKYNAKERATPTPLGEHYKFTCENIRVAILGSQERMGATTMAIGMVNWLHEVGATVCYVEANQKQILPLLAREYNEPFEDGAFITEDVKFTQTNPQEQYNFIVYDFGASFEKKLPLIEQMDIVILMCGGKMYEIPFSLRSLQSLEQTEAYVCPLFLSEERRDSYVELFQSDYHELLYPEYQPDFMDTEPNRANYKKIIEKHIATV